MKQPIGSLDTEHVLPPDPANFWLFAAGETRTLVMDRDRVTPYITFRVDKLHDTWIEGTLVLGKGHIVGELHIDHPVVVTRMPETREPHITLTLRAIENGRAEIQVSGHPSLQQGKG